MINVNTNPVVDEGAPRWSLASSSTEDTTRVALALLHDICCEIELLLSSVNNSSEGFSVSQEDDAECRIKALTDAV